MEIQKEFTKYYSVETVEGELEQSGEELLKLVTYLEYLLDDVERIKANHFLSQDDREMFIEILMSTLSNTLPKQIADLDHYGTEITQIGVGATEIGTSNNEIINGDIEQ